MLKVEGADPAVLSRRLRHHAELVRPLINTLMYALVFESRIARDTDVHVIRQSRTGPGSFSLVTASGKQYHFRLSATPGAVDVRDAYRGGNVVATIRSEPQARRFVRRL